MPSAMKLFGRDGDIKVTKVLIAARIAGLKLQLDTSLSESQLSERSPTGRAPFLETEQGTLVGTNTMLRYIAQLCPAAELYGRSSYDSGLVDAWMDYVSTTLEVPTSVLALPLKKGKGARKGAKKALAMAKGNVAAALTVLDKHLQSQTWLASERMTIADIALVAAMKGAMETHFSDEEKAATPNFMRWLMTCIHQPAVAAVLSPDDAAPAAAAGKSAAGAEESKSDAASSDAAASSAAAAAAAGSSAAFASAVDTGAGSSIPRLYSRRRVVLRDLFSAGGDGSGAAGSVVTVAGWAKTIREAAKGKLAFVSLNDGSAHGNLQIVAKRGKCDGFDALKSCGGVGASLQFSGEIILSPKDGQVIEMQAQSVKVYGTVDAAAYPLSKKEHTLEYLRSVAHLRCRTDTISAVVRVRNACCFATHKFFQDHGFKYIHTPLITASDCEGAGEMFSVSTLLKEDEPVKTTKAGLPDYTADFFRKPAYLTVSGQLNVECFAVGMSDVYTFGPTFRAENSHTARHLAEFWMIEPELCFADLDDLQNLAEDYTKFCVQYVLDTCLADVQYLSKFEEGLVDNLRAIVAAPFERITYTEAVELLTKPETLEEAKFEEVPKWGDDLGSEHERYLTEQVFKKPVIVTKYPKGIKAFYMRASEDGDTVDAMDVLVPRIGELIGGSVREERLDVLQARLAELGLEEAPYWWYLDLRRYGSVPHAGFGLGLERLVMLTTAISNIRDTIPFPRWPGQAEF
eukprot:PLAT14013.1.p1 GENE.PLAT14013.1~~PLAT14013.1.p1  ORF type:complete len:743 (+),score=400.85 PLAT14013.1:1-2229(+)